MKKKIVVALGGNALLQRGQVLSAENQYQNIAVAAQALAELSQEYRVILVHGNGPQVGLLALQNQAYQEVPAYPLDILVAQTQGMVGYMLAQSLSALAQMPPVTTVVTRVVVDAQDEAFERPAKFIGPVYRLEQKDELQQRWGWHMKTDGQYLRRVVASPQPQRIVELDTIDRLQQQGQLVICCGGGGAPVFAEGAHYYGAEAVIDKDLAASLLARQLNADHLMILTDADAVYQDWGTPQQRALRCVTPEQLYPFAGDDGSMGPKAQAAIDFVRDTGRNAYIGALSDATAILAGDRGTCVRA
ncbi:carbamate kinase [Serratia rubidaea]|uniref:carbamate kinase n=1 Tax=Serratia rubidaea TaxID=61652 RepID=UPI0022B8F438|nr:carbamate kinase [Serratia rubidaea]WBF44413.1 carbamate kinase [Serratia rubidaea]